MSRKTLWLAGFISFVVLVLNFQVALAHETITAGDYEIEVGWLNEPPIAGEKNAIVLTVMDTRAGGQQPVEDISSLTVSISYGGQSKVLIFQSLHEDTPGQFTAPILPTIPGEYEVVFSGFLGETAVDAGTHVEEVQPIDTLAFPAAEAATQNTPTDWLVWLSILIGLIGVGLGVTALRKAG